jgi:hypothetical protein
MGTTRSRRLSLDPDVEAAAIEMAEQLRVPVTAVIGASLEAQSEDAIVAARAAAELQAWRDGTAVAWDVLTLPSPQATLTLALGGWIDEPSEPTDPFARAGYGVNAGVRGYVVAASARGYWRMRDPRGSCRIVAFRRGLPVLHGWASDWRMKVGTNRRYAGNLLVSDGTKWVDVDTGASTRFDPKDLEVERALTNLVVLPTGSQNPVSWLEAGGHR